MHRDIGGGVTHKSINLSCVTSPADVLYSLYFVEKPTLRMLRHRFSGAVFNIVYYYFIRIQIRVFLLIYMVNMSERSQDKLGFL